MELFDKMYNGTVTLSDDEKKKTLRRWFRDEYDVLVKDDAVLLELLSIHSPDSDQMHLGHPEVISESGQAVFQLVRFADGWHAIMFRPEYPEHKVIHPKSELASFKHPENQRFVNEMKGILKSAAIVRREQVEQVAPPEPAKVTEPTVVIDGSNFEFILPADQPEGVDALPMDTVTATNNGFLDLGLGSISIDLNPGEKKD